MDMKEKCNAVWDKCEAMADRYYQKAVALLPQIKQFEKDFEPARDEYCLKARYLHRGFYCPSLILEHVVDNMKRGRLAKRMTSRTKPTNGYFYDRDDIMRMTETYYPNGAFTTEYLFYEDNIVYGITCESNYHISMISVEEYAGDRIQSYLLAYYSEGSSGKPWQMEFESYLYGDGCLEAQWYDMWVNHYRVPQEKFCTYSQYYFSTDEYGKVQQVDWANAKSQLFLI